MAGIIQMDVGGSRPPRTPQVGALKVMTPHPALQPNGAYRYQLGQIRYADPAELIGVNAVKVTCSFFQGALEFFCDESET